MNSVQRPKRLDRRIIKNMIRTTFVIVLLRFCYVCVCVCVTLIGTRERSQRKWQKLVYWLLSWSNFTDKRHDQETDKDELRTQFPPPPHGNFRNRKWSAGLSLRFDVSTDRDDEDERPWPLQLDFFLLLLLLLVTHSLCRFTIIVIFFLSPRLTLFSHYSSRPLVTNQLLTSFVVWFICVWIDDNSLRIVSSFILEILC